MPPVIIKTSAIIIKKTIIPTTTYQVNELYKVLCKLSNIRMLIIMSEYLRWFAIFS
jgi:hypothetical protein